MTIHFCTIIIIQYANTKQTWLVYSLFIGHSFSGKQGFGKKRQKLEVLFGFRIIWTFQARYYTDSNGQFLHFVSWFWDKFKNYKNSSVCQHNMLSLKDVPPFYEKLVQSQQKNQISFSSFELSTNQEVQALWFFVGKHVMSRNTVVTRFLPCRSGISDMFEA